MPEDRKHSGLVLDMTVRENITLADLARYARMRMIMAPQNAAWRRTSARSSKIKTPSVETSVVTLSGGNQQKVVLAKWLSMRPSC